MMRIAVIGAGGVGGYFGARLADAGHDVVLVARGPHLEAIRAVGLRVVSPLGDTTVDVPATDDPSEIGPCDVVLLCVKAYDTTSVAHQLAPLLRNGTAVVSLQNGVDNEEKIAAVIGGGYVVGGAAYIFSTITEPGLVSHTGGPARIVFGELDGSRSPRIEQLLDACHEAGIDAEVPSDIHALLWSKFAFICATAGMTAAVRLPLGEIRACEESWQMFQQIAAEVAAVARAEGVALPAHVLEQLVGLAVSLPATAYSSLHHDLATGHRMELDALNGAVVRRAASVGVDVPANAAVYALLRPWAARADVG